MMVVGRWVMMMDRGIIMIVVRLGKFPSLPMIIGANALNGTIEM